MGTQDKIGENEGIDAGTTDDVSFVPSEKAVENDEERSDAQRLADGDILIDEGDGEMFVSPDSVYTQKSEVDTSEKKAKEDPDPKPSELEKDEKGEQGKAPADKDQVKKPAAAPDPVQKRINKITREKYDTQRENDRLAKENADLKKQIQERSVEKAKEKLETEKPDYTNFETEAEYHEALGRWAAKMELHESSVAKSQADPPAKEQPAPEDPRTRIIDLGMEAHDDFMEIISSTENITEMMVAAAADSDHAHEIFYHLGQNHAEAERLANLKSFAAVSREIGKIEARFIDEVPEVFVPAPGADNELLEKSKKKPLASAPPPVKPLGGGGKTIKNLETMSIAEYNDSRGFTRDGTRKSRVA